MTTTSTARRRWLWHVGLGTTGAAIIGAGILAGSHLERLDKGVELQLAQDIPGFFWPNPPVLPDFALQASTGQTIGRNSLLGKWSVLYFGYTSCPDACPTALTVLAQVERELQSLPALASKFQGVFISVDPARDRDAIGKYVRHFSPHFIGATGDDKALMAIARPLGIVYLRQRPDQSGEYLVDHSNSLLVVDPQGRLVALFNGPHEAKHIAEQLRKIHAIVG